MTNAERGRALAGGKDQVPWHPAVGSSFVRGTYTPRGVKPLRPTAGEVPTHSTGDASRPAGRSAQPTKTVHIPKLTASIFPREAPQGPVAPLSMGLTYGLGGGNYDAGYFTDADQL